MKRLKGMKKNKEYIAILKSGPLQIEFEEYDHNKKIADYINCDWIDHTTVFDDLENSNIDVWLDDEGLINQRIPVFFFVDDNGKFTGQLSGDLAFLKHDDMGDSYGLTWEECQSLKNWLRLHDYGQFTYRPDDDRKEKFFAYICKPFETVQHRKRIEDMKKRFKEDGGFVVEL